MWNISSLAFLLELIHPKQSKVSSQSLAARRNRSHIHDAPYLSVVQLDQLFELRTLLLRVGASRHERTTWRRIDETWRFTGVVQFEIQPFRIRGGQLQQFRVRMERFVHETSCGTFFNDQTRVHDADPVRNVLRRCEIVRDVDHRNGVVLFQFQEQVQYARLYGNIQHGGGLVRQQDLRSRQDRSGYHDSLFLSTRKFVWKFLERVDRQLDLFERLFDEVSVQLEDLDGPFEDALYLLCWIECGERILKDHLNVPSVFEFFFPAELLFHFLSEQEDLALVLKVDPREHAQQRGLPTTALTDDGEYLFLSQFDVDPSESFELQNREPAPDVETLLQTLRDQYR